jgi:hypothetical protein
MLKWILTKQHVRLCTILYSVGSRLDSVEAVVNNIETSGFRKGM